MRFPRVRCPTSDMLKLDCVGPTFASGRYGDRGVPWPLIDDDASTRVCSANCMITAGLLRLPAAMAVPSMHRLAVCGGTGAVPPSQSL